MTKKPRNDKRMFFVMLTKETSHYTIYFDSLYAIPPYVANDKKTPRNNKRLFFVMLTKETSHYTIYFDSLYAIPPLSE